MRNKLLPALLLAATATQPLLAQDHDQRSRWLSGGQAQRDDRPAPAPAPQPQPQQRAPGSENGGRPGFRGVAEAPNQPRAQAQIRADANANLNDRRGIAVGEPNPGGRWQNRGDDRRPDQNGRPDWNGRPGSNGRPDWNGQRDANDRVNADRRDWNDRANRGSFGDRRDDGRRDWNDRRDDGRRDWNGGRPGAGGAWSNGWRNDRRYDWRGYRNQNRSIFRGPRYYAPQGWSYRRFSVGYRLAPFLFAQQYWIDDPYDYRLPPAYGPYRWVRYYDDVLLVDVRSGVVVDMIQDFFY